MANKKKQNPNAVAVDVKEAKEYVETQETFTDEDFINENSESKEVEVKSEEIQDTTEAERHYFSVLKALNSIDNPAQARYIKKRVLRNLKKK